MVAPRVIRIEAGHEGAAIRQVADVLRGGGMAVIPTETVYGVAVHPLQGNVERIFLAKGREQKKPIPMLAASLEEVERYGAILGEQERRLAVDFWPGPLTLILKVGDAWEGFRVPDHGPARMLLKEAGGMLRVTSANRSGEPPALTVQSAIRALGAWVDVALDDGPSPGGVASTVVRVDDGIVTILRDGAISRDRFATVR